MPQPISVSSYTDDQFLVAIQAEDPKALLVLHDRLHRLIRSMVARLCAGRSTQYSDIVEDVTNETFALVLDPTVCRFDPLRCRASQYLFGQTCNAYHSILRQRQPACIDLDNKSRLEMPRAGRAAGVVYQNTLGSRMALVPDHNLEDQDEVRLILEEDRGEIRELVSSHFFGGESMVGIAARMGVSHSTVSRKITGFLNASRLKFA